MERTVSVLTEKLNDDTAKMVVEHLAANIIKAHIRAHVDRKFKRWEEEEARDMYHF